MKTTKKQPLWRRYLARLFGVPAQPPVDDAPVEFDVVPVAPATGRESLPLPPEQQRLLDEARARVITMGGGSRLIDTRPPGSPPLSPTQQLAVARLLGEGNVVHIVDATKPSDRKLQPWNENRGGTDEPSETNEQPENR